METNELSVVNLRVSQIVPDREQPRKEFDEDKLNELAESIKRHGLLEPVIVKKSGAYYKIIAGERRWRASRIAGLKMVPAIIKELSAREEAEIALVENLQREDLNPIEEALAYQKMCNEYHLSHQELADSIGVKSRASITNAMRLLNLSENIQAKISDGTLSKGHAKVIASVSEHDKQEEIMNIILSKGLNVRETEKLVRDFDKKKKKQKKQILPDSNFQMLEESLSEILGTKVKIEQKKEFGQIHIDYYGVSELDRIYELLLELRS